MHFSRNIELRFVFGDRARTWPVHKSISHRVHSRMSTWRMCGLPTRQPPCKVTVVGEDKTQMKSLQLLQMRQSAVRTTS